MTTNFNQWVLTPEGMSALGSAMVAPLTALELAYTCGVIRGMAEWREKMSEEEPVFHEGLQAREVGR
jgi:hypothetical protein